MKMQLSFAGDIPAGFPEALRQSFQDQIVLRHSVAMIYGTPVQADPEADRLFNIERERICERFGVSYEWAKP